MSDHGTHTDLEVEDIPIDEQLSSVNWIRARILHVFSIYPKLSGSMLQVGIGTSIAPALWRPVLKTMIEEGSLKQTNVQAETPSGRIQSYTVISCA